MNYPSVLGRSEAPAVNAVEFEAVAKDGRIDIPARLVRQVQGQVRVIVLYEDEAAPGNLFDSLMDNPARVPDFVPLTRDEVHERR